MLEPGHDVKPLCSYNPLNVVSCQEEEPLEPGQIHRCYTSSWERFNADGAYLTGVRRGCIAVDEVNYGSVPTTTDTPIIQDIFGFILGPGDRQMGRADFCDSISCNKEPARPVQEDGLQCYQCYNSELNGILQAGYDTRDLCSNVPSNIVNCLDEEPLQVGQVHRCYTSLWERQNADGTYLTEIRRGCVAVDEVNYASLPTTTDTTIIQEIFGFTLEAGDSQIGRADFCDLSTCNNEPPRTVEDTGKCPDGSDEVACPRIYSCALEDCPAFPDAICRQNFCGECSVEFFDAQGNRVDCTQTGEAGVDTTPPVISGCPSNIQRSVPVNYFFEQIDWEEPEATDSESGPATLKDKSHPSPRLFVKVGDAPRSIRYVFEDQVGNEAVCEFTVSAVVEGTGTVKDNTPPEISDCPSDIEETAQLGLTYADVTWIVPAATDDSGDEPRVRTSHTPGSRFTVNQPTIVTYSFNDEAGNKATCAFTVLVVTNAVDTNTDPDTTPPLIENCSEDVILTVPVNQKFALVEWTEPTATDDGSGSVTLKYQTFKSPFFFVQVGSTPTTVEYIFRDEAGNEATCSFTVSATAATASGSNRRKRRQAVAALLEVETELSINSSDEYELPDVRVTELSVATLFAIAMMALVMTALAVFICFVFYRFKNNRNKLVDLKTLT
ncbi:uncharacterized protein [Amphiura filiformis]|uniref:uncharacterized protein n=1 Tax=Amphiura filiformis TaxID=82378 RepID=UPI003B217BB4